MNVASPCIHVCRLDDRDVCTGCFRTRGEIARWMQMSEEEKFQVVSRLSTRQRKSGVPSSRIFFEDEKEEDCPIE